MDERFDVNARRASFLSAGMDYDQARPDYPLDAIRWVVGSATRLIVDLGCGSGKLTHQLSQFAEAAVGVDPSVEMLRVLSAKRLPGVAGAAEALPLRDTCVDVITAATAFHWFDRAKALSEMRRVLRAEGRIGFLWNIRDDSVQWVRALSDIVSSEDALSATIDGFEEYKARLFDDLTANGFKDPEHNLFDHEQVLDADGLVRLVRSRSYIAMLPEREKTPVLTAVRALCREHPQLRDRETFVLPYKTRTFRALIA